MKKVNRLWGILVLVVFVTGCPDGPPQILRDEKNTAAEVADYLTKVTDEDSAKEALAIADRLKDRWEKINKRREKFVNLADTMELIQFSFLQDPNGSTRAIVNLLKSQEDMDLIKNAESMAYKKEIEASANRLKSEADRVGAISMDPKVSSDIRQFETKVFGGALKMPNEPLQIDTKRGERYAIKWVKFTRENAGLGLIPQLLLYISGGLLLGGAGLWFFFRR